MKWENRDWFWLLGLMVFVLGTSFMYKSQFMNLISYASTFVSIALAFIAIYISVREATKTDKIKDETLVSLVELKERIGQIDNKVSSIDVERIKMGIDEAVSNFKQGLGELNKNDGEAEIQEKELFVKLENKINKLSEDLKISVENQHDGNSFRSSQDNYMDNLLKKAYRELRSKSTSGSFTIQDIWERFNENTPYAYSRREVIPKVNTHISKGILRENKDGTYSFYDDI